MEEIEEGISDKGNNISKGSGVEPNMERSQDGKIVDLCRAERNYVVKVWEGIKLFRLDVVGKREPVRFM